MGKNKVRHRLPKNIQLSLQCEAVDFDGKILDTAETKSELLSTMKDKGFERGEFEIRWVCCDMLKDGTMLFNSEGVGENREEAIREFWENYKSK